MDDLYKNISKNYYLPEQVTKNIAIPWTTSILNMTLSSMKAQCTVNPNYKTDTGISFSNNSKIVNRADLPNFYMGIPTSSVASQIGGVLYGKISSIIISCETSTESTKDFLIYSINSSPRVTPLEPAQEIVNCYFTGSSSSQSCYTSIGDIVFSCSGQYSCSVPVYGSK